MLLLSPTVLQISGTSHEVLHHAIKKHQVCHLYPRPKDYETLLSLRGVFSEHVLSPGLTTCPNIAWEGVTFSHLSLAHIIWTKVNNTGSILGSSFKGRRQVHLSL